MLIAFSLLTSMSELEVVRSTSILFFQSSPVLLFGFQHFLPPGYCLRYSAHTWQGVRILITTPYETYCVSTEIFSGELPTLMDRYSRHVLDGSVKNTAKAPIHTDIKEAMNYMSKVKTRFTHEPEIYQGFLELLQSYQKGSKPLRDVFPEVTQLFRSAPDLVQEFRRFLPKLSGSTCSHRASVRERK